MNTPLKMSSFDQWLAGKDQKSLETVRVWNDAPKERNQVARGIMYSLPISALLWCGLLAMAFYR